jgi:hypothetical protein
MVFHPRKLYNAMMSTMICRRCIILNVKRSKISINLMILSLDEIIWHRWNMNGQGALVEWYWESKTEALGEENQRRSSRVPTWIFLRWRFMFTSDKSKNHCLSYSAAFVRKRRWLILTQCSKIYQKLREKIRIPIIQTATFEDHSSKMLTTKPTRLVHVILSQW